MKLYEYRQAPNPRRVRFFMAEKGIDVASIETVQVDIVSAENRGAAFREKNPMGTVPVLELDDGSYLAESTAICRYFEGLHPEPALMGDNPKSRAHIEMWDRRMELNLFFPVAMAFRHTTGHFADRENTFADYGADCLENAKKMFAFLERHLADQEFIAGSAFSIADITAVVAIDFARIIKLRVDAQTQPHLAAWHERIAARPAASA